MLTYSYQIDEENIEANTVYTDREAWYGVLRLGPPGSGIAIHGTAAQLRSFASAAARLALEVDQREHEENIEGIQVHTDLVVWYGSLRVGQPGSQMMLTGNSRQLRSLATAAARLANEVDIREDEEQDSG